jgi:integrase/recombinase XerD
MKLFEDHLAIRYAPRTATDYMTTVRALTLWLSKRGIALGDVRTADLQAYQAQLYALRKADGTPYSLGNQINRLAVVKGFFRFLCRRGYMLTDPSAPLEYPRREQRLPRGILTRDECRRLVEAPDTSTSLGLRDRAILETFYATGIRAGELASLKCADVDTEDRLLRVVLGKGAKDRNVRAHPRGR